MEMPEISPHIYGQLINKSAKYEGERKVSSVSGIEKNNIHLQKNGTGHLTPYSKMNSVD